MTIERIEETIHDLFIKKKMKLSAAESCTGGHISAKLTALSGASNFFLGSIICYCNFMKKKLLFVEEKLLKEKGAVSRECVEKMALSLLDITDSDYSIAVSGIAGPNGGT
ncbi:MAG TPA: CinA family protein, partial [Parachlamydiaceae bacterium]|nr:CinA family protein [Parachlamydiaceae bacterium]